MSSWLMLASVFAPITANAQTNSTMNNINTSTTASSGGHVDSSPIVAVFIITKDRQGDLSFLPSSATIKPDEEILVLNNDTTSHTVLNGKGTDDPLSGKLFAIGAIQPKAFSEYAASNIQDGKYPFYLQSDPSVKGELTVASTKK
jgi:plastocyanin